MIDRTIDRRVSRLIYDRSQSSTIARKNDRRVPRLIYDRSQNSTIDRTIDRLWLPLVVRFPTMYHAIDLLQSLLRLLEIVANIADQPIVRSSNRTIRCDCGFNSCVVNDDQSTKLQNTIVSLFIFKISKAVNIESVTL